MVTKIIKKKGKNRCLRCGHKWQTRPNGLGFIPDTPNSCPTCNSTRWDSKARKMKGRHR